MGDVAKKMAGWLKKRGDKVQSEMPEGYSVEKVKRLALHLMQANEKIQKCTAESIYLAILKSAHLDLSFDLGECHLVPYGRQADFQIDYKGLVKLCKRSGNISHVKAEVVREGDHIEYQRSLDPSERRLIHRPVPFNDGEIIGAYAIFDLTIGYSEFEVLSRADIDTIRGKAANGSMMWNEFFGEGAKKAVIRRGIKTLELLPEDKRAIVAEAAQLYDIGRVQQVSQSSTARLNEQFAPKAIEDNAHNPVDVPTEMTSGETADKGEEIEV